MSSKSQGDGNMRIKDRKPINLFIAALGLFCGAGVAFAAPAAAAEEQSADQTGQDPPTAEEQAALTDSGIIREETDAQGITGTCGAAPLVYQFQAVGDDGSALQPLSSRNAAICAAAVVLAANLGCAAILADCAIGTVLTVGSLAIPCVLLAALACGAGHSAAGVVATYCPDLVRR
jgi:hypothetical protein